MNDDELRQAREWLDENFKYFFLSDAEINMTHAGFEQLTLEQRRLYERVWAKKPWWYKLWSRVYHTVVMLLWEYTGWLPKYISSGQMHADVHEEIKREQKQDG